MDLHACGLDPVTLNAGLTKPRRGFTLVAGKEKLGVGKTMGSIDRGDGNLISFRQFKLVNP